MQTGCTGRAQAARETGEFCCIRDRAQSPMVQDSPPDRREQLATAPERPRHVFSDQHLSTMSTAQRKLLMTLFDLWSLN